MMDGDVSGGCMEMKERGQDKEERKAMGHGWLEEAPQERATSKDVQLSVHCETSIFIHRKMA